MSENIQPSSEENQIVEDLTNKESSEKLLEFNDKELTRNEEFNNHLGDVLTYIISDSLEKKKGQIGHINANTDTRTQSST